MGLNEPRYWPLRHRGRQGKRRVRSGHGASSFDAMDARQVTWGRVRILAVSVAARSQSSQPMWIVSRD
jgi:hypothetical protein